MDEVFIDIPEFTKLINQLESAADYMRAATERLRDAGCDGLGWSFLDNAARNFHSEWGYGIKKIGELSEELVEGMKAAKQLYETQDEMNRRLIHGVGEYLPDCRIPGNGSGSIIDGAPRTGSSLNLGG